MRQTFGARFLRQRSIHHIHTQGQTLTMKLQPLALLSSVSPFAAVLAWSPLQTKRWSSSLHSSVAPEVPKTSEAVAKGSIVSYFHGGLAAIQLRDDLMADLLPVGEAAPLYDTLDPPLSPLMAQRLDNNNNGDDLIGRTVTFGNGATVRNLFLLFNMPWLYLIVDT